MLQGIDVTNPKHTFSERRSGTSLLDSDNIFGTDGVAKEQEQKPEEAGDKGVTRKVPTFKQGPSKPCSKQPHF